MGSPQEEDLAHLDPATADIFRQAPQRTGLVSYLHIATTINCAYRFSVYDIFRA